MANWPNNVISCAVKQNEWCSKIYVLFYYIVFSWPFCRVFWTSELCRIHIPLIQCTSILWGTTSPMRCPSMSFISSNKKLKVKLSRTRYRALGPELIPVYRQSACRWLYKSSHAPLLSARPAVTFPAEERHRPSTSTKLYCLLTKARRCEQLAQGCYAALLR